jgi:hypothetical protein
MLAGALILGAAWSWACLWHGWSAHFLFLALACTLMCALAQIDWRTGLLPDALNYPLLALGLGAGRCGRASQAGCHEQPLQRAARKRGLKRCRRLRHLAHSVAEEGWRGRKGFPARLAWSGLQLLGTGSFCPGTVQT